VVDFTLTGNIRKADNHKWDADSDIPELNMSVKSARFTLAYALNGETKEEKINDYFSRVKSTSWAYITTEGQIYIMNRIEFHMFLMLFCTLERDSTKNGGKVKVRFAHETAKVREWLRGQV
jgi:predicted PolB exonuclease-like 3'-5' exonuclease